MMLEHLLPVLLTICMWFVPVKPSSSDISVTCVDTCSINGNSLNINEGSAAQLRIGVPSTRFNSLDVEYGDVLLFRATQSAVIEEKNKFPTWRNENTDPKWFSVSSKTPIRSGNVHQILFSIRNMELEDDKKELSIAVIHDNQVLKRNIAMVVKGGPNNCGPLKQSFPIYEGSDEEVQLILCANPPPTTVYAYIGNSYYEGKKILSRSNSAKNTYFYVIKLSGLKRSQCGYTLDITAKNGYKELLLQSGIVVIFTPRVPLHFNSRYDSETDCAHLTWERVESGKCAVTYEVKYDNPYDSTIQPQLFTTKELHYKKCGTVSGFNFTIRSLVNEHTLLYKRSSPYSSPLSKHGYLASSVAQDDGFPWYYTLIIVLLVLLLLIILFLVSYRCCTSGKKDDLNKDKNWESGYGETLKHSEEQKLPKEKKKKKSEKKVEISAHEDMKRIVDIMELRDEHLQENEDKDPDARINNNDNNNNNNNENVISVLEKNLEAAENKGFDDKEEYPLPTLTRKENTRFGRTRKQNGSKSDLEDNKEDLDLVKLDRSKMSHVSFDDNEIKATACKSIKHIEGENPFRVILSNLDDEAVKLYWKDYHGNERFCYKIDAGKDHALTAFINYSYVARNPTTRKLAHFIRHDDVITCDVIYRGLEFGVTEDKEDEVSHVMITVHPEQHLPPGYESQRCQINDEDEDVAKVDGDRLVYATVNKPDTNEGKDDDISVFDDDVEKDDNKDGQDGEDKNEQGGEDEDLTKITYSSFTPENDRKEQDNHTDTNDEEKDTVIDEQVNDIVEKDNDINKSDEDTAIAARIASNRDNMKFSTFFPPKPARSSSVGKINPAATPPPAAPPALRSVSVPNTTGSLTSSVEEEGPEVPAKPPWYKPPVKRKPVKDVVAALENKVVWVELEETL